jgi:hypothetical protein
MPALAASFVRASFKRRKWFILNHLIRQPEKRPPVGGRSRFAHFLGRRGKGGMPLQRRGATGIIG